MPTRQPPKKLNFEPLFTSAPTFVIGYDNLDDQGIRDMLAKDEYLDAPASGDPAQAVAWWFEYDNATLDLDPLQERTFVAWALESNSENDIGGSDGGCEELLGATCVSDLKSLFTGLGEDAESQILEYFQSPPERIDCPSVLWDDGYDTNRATHGTVFATPLLGSGTEIPALDLDENDIFTNAAHARSMVC